MIYFFKIYNIINKVLSYLISTALAKLKMKMLSISFGAHFKISGKIIFQKSLKGEIIFGDNIHLISRFNSNLVGLYNPCVFETIKSGKILIQNNSSMSSVVISSMDQVIIGSNVKIGGNVKIFDHDFHSINYLDRREKLEKLNKVKCKKIEIGDDVFIGVNSIILKGVKIGAKSIIGAGSVVSIPIIPENSLVVGNPARIVKCLDN